MAARRQSGGAWALRPAVLVLVLALRGSAAPSLVGVGILRCRPCPDQLVGAR